MQQGNIALRHSLKLNSGSLAMGFFSIRTHTLLSKRGTLMCTYLRKNVNKGYQKVKRYSSRFFLLNHETSSQILTCEVKLYMKNFHHYCQFLDKKIFKKKWIFR